MTEEMKTYKIICENCDKPFHVRFPLVQADAEGTGDVVVNCQYCGENVKITIPRIYIEEKCMLRGLKSKLA